MFSVGVFQPCAAMTGQKRVSDSPATVAPAAKVPHSSAASALGSGEDPLKIPASWLPCSAQKSQKPVLPAPDEDHVGRHVMKEVIPWVLQELPTYLQSSGYDLDRSVCLTKRAPLQIQPSKKDKRR